MNTIMKEIFTDKHTTVVLKAEKEKVLGEVIYKTASNLYFVDEDAHVKDISDVLMNENIAAVAVTKKNGYVIGIIVTNDLLNLLGKPYGRELYLSKTAADICKEAVYIYYKKNIFAVAEKYSTIINHECTSYLCLTDKKGAFKGIVSTKDILIYLSEITRKDIVLAKQIQNSIVKNSYYEKTECFEVAGGSKMAKGIGGDFYSIKKYSGHEWIFSLCDVSGKGVSASLLSVTIGGMFKIYNFSKGIRSFIQQLNDYIFNSFDLEKFVTGIWMKFDERDGRVGMYDMGHSYCYIIRGDEVFRVKSSDRNLPLGLVDNIEPEKKSFRLLKNDLFLCISDGIEEQINIENEEYGINRVTAIIKKNKDCSIEEIRDKIFEDINTFRKGQPQSDDMTMFILKY